MSWILIRLESSDSISSSFFKNTILFLGAHAYTDKPEDKAHPEKAKPLHNGILNDWSWVEQWETFNKGNMLKL